LFIAAGMLSCSGPRMYFEASATYVDYRPYTETGFFITESNSVGFDYKPVSSVMAIARSGYLPQERRSNVTDSKPFDDVYYKPERIKAGVRTATPKDAVRELVHQARALGANGIINLARKSNRFS